MPKKTVSITKGRKNLFKIAEEVQKPDTYYVFTVNQTPQVVLMSYREFRLMFEIMDRLEESEVLEKMKQLKQERGGVSWEELKKKMGFEEGDLSGGVVVGEEIEDYQPYKRKKKRKGDN